MNKKIPLILAIATICTGCYSTCDLADPIDPPSCPFEQAAEEDSDEPLLASQGELPEDWWLLFQDEQLNQFIEQALDNHPSLQAAETKVLAAESEANKVRSILFPQVTLGGDIQRWKISKTSIVEETANGFSIGGPGFPTYYTQYETQLNFSYNFDVWGKNRNALRAAIGEVYAKMADEAMARLALSVSTALVYFQWQIDYQLRELGQLYIANRENNLALVQNLVQNHLNSNIDLLQAQNDLDIAKQSLLDTEAALAIHEHQLKAYLAGDFCETIQPLDIVDKPLPEIPLPSCIPLHLIAHRPDILSQLWLIESAGRQIQVAKAKFYPDFNLVGLIGFQTIELRKLFEAQSSYWLAEPAFTLPIFEGGLLRANLRNTEANYDLAVYQYNQLILNAVRDVLDALSLVKNYHQQWELFQREQENRSELLHLTNLRVENHLNSSIDSVTLEKSVLLAKQQTVIALGNTIQALLSLVKALGGGYS